MWSKKNILHRMFYKNSHFKTFRMNKKGSYILEASVILPAFIITMVLLISIVSVIGVWENVSYGCIEELRLDMAKSALTRKLPTLTIAINSRVRKENKNLSSFFITDYKHLYNDNGIDDLIKVSFKSSIDKKNPLSSISTLKYSGTIVGRGFSGTYYGGKDDGSSTVYIFPDDGKKYHNKNCGYLKACCHQVFLNVSIKKKYHSCPNCKSQNAPYGSPVFCFERTGEAYHMSYCKSVERYYIGVSQKSALEKGYIPCSKCGG